MGRIAEWSSGEEAPTEATVAGSATKAALDAQRAADLARLRRGLRAVGATLGFICAAVLSLAHASGLGWEFHILNGLLFLGIIVIACVFAAVSRGTHVEQGERYRARLFTRTIELQDMAMRDELTQLFNRRYFFQRLEEELGRVRTRHGCLAVMVLDVDKLKGINDTFGHQVGDAVLFNLARLLVKLTRVADIPARLGGDEFGVIMLETSKGAAVALGERVQQALDASPIYEQDGRSIKLSVSVGVSGFPWSGESVDELLRCADTHMYAAKAAGHRGTDISSRTPSRSGPRA